MDKILFWALFLGLLIQTSFGHPTPGGIPDEESLQSTEDDDTQQQQQKIDTESLEEFTKQLKTKSNPQKVEKLKSGDLEDDPCLDPKKIGPCKASIPSFFFNKVEGKCQAFIFGGCGANKNNFKGLTTCEATCAKHYISKSENICEKVAVLPGGIQCRAYKPRWTYNSTEGKCVEFIYGGCRGTENNFLTKENCEETCESYEKSDDDDAIVTELTPSQPLPDMNICSLPKSIGICHARMERYFFNKEHNRCEKFMYGGCGNHNRFKSAEECVRACGGDAPAEDAECSNIDCPWALYTHYTTFDCKPVYDGNACCPTRFECPDKVQGNNTLGDARSLNAPEESTQPKCFYKGKSYSIGEDVSEASDSGSCRAGCMCVEDSSTGAKITCASIECPENFGPVTPGKENCLLIYKRASCCSFDIFCPNDTLTIIEPQDQQQEETGPFKCEVDGVGYYEGQRMYPKKFPCLRCICQKGYNGTLTDEFCEKIDCGIEIYYSNYLAKGCAPVYFQSVDGTASCCPISWECPQANKDQLPVPASPTPLSTSTTLAPIINPINLIQPVPPTPRPNQALKSQDICYSPKIEGRCKGSRPRYFYNPQTNNCEQFNYTGCGGNENNFVSSQDCQRLCNGTFAIENDRPLLRSLGSSNRPETPRSIYVTEVDPCTMPIKIGNCRGYFPRWFYSPEENSCQLFIFGGCRGNSNNFYSKESCEATCTNSIPVDNLRTSVPSESGGDSSMVNFGEDATSKSVRTHVDLCSLPAEGGRCKAFIRRFYYDSEANECRVFVYGGCSGNSNNFMNARDCKRRCIPRESDNSGSDDATGTSRSGQTPPYRPDTEETNQNGPQPPAFGFLEKCRLPRKSGTCLGIIPSYYYNAETEKCTQFIYTGCFGNANRFTTIKECENSCKKPVETASQNEGTIEGRMSLESRNPVGATSIINQEINNNTFMIPSANDFIRNKPARSETVDNDKSMCNLAPAPGSCKSHSLRYYWDSTKQTCAPFVYTGCRGNKNNFLTESDCLSTCGKQPTIEQLTSEGVLSCTFGNETLPIGASVNGGHSGSSSPDIMPCGVPICQCITPPSVTCVQKSCPPPLLKQICLTFSCEQPNCEETTGVDGCPMCQCSNDELESQQVQVETFVKSIKG